MKVKRGNNRYKIIKNGDNFKWTYMELCRHWLAANLPVAW